MSREDFKTLREIIAEDFSTAVQVMAVAITISAAFVIYTKLVG